MSKNREVELKLELTAADSARLRGHPLLAQSRPVEEDLLSIYFDTPKAKLRKAGFSLRVRRAGDRFVQTIKADESGAGLFDRPEWEAPVAGLVPDAAAAADTPVAGIIGRRSFARLKEVARSEVRRTQWRVSAGGTTIAAALDDGRVRGGEAEQDVCELELELIDGKAENLFALASELGANVPLRLGVMSKSERGFALAEGRIGKVAKALPVHLDDGMSAGEGFALILLSCLRHFRLNEPLLVVRREAGALHQARVAMRRLRSALSLFRRMLRGDMEFARLREELRWFTGALGEARNLDVFLARIEPDAAERAPLLEAREALYDTAIATLETPRFTTLMIDLVAWIETGDWRETRTARRPILGFTTKRIDALWADIEIGGAMLKNLADEQRHQLRIRIKKIRYALEFVHDLHRSAALRQKRFGAALEKLQDSLGHLNDMATARKIALEHLGTEMPAMSADDDKAHLAAARKAFRQLARVGPYWREAVG